jgi:hypothetical protein
METATETSQNNRELTSGEIKIAFAQIEDRLHRVAKAQTKLAKYQTNLYDYAFSEDDDNDDYHTRMESEIGQKISMMQIKIRQQFDIPESVFLFISECEGKLTTENFRLISPRIKDWLHGKMTDEGFADMYLFFEEDAQCDWGWILMEMPFYYFQRGTLAPEGFNDDENVGELKKIGTRSRNKNYREIVSGFSKAYGVVDEPPPPPKKPKIKSTVNTGPVKTRARKK